MAHMHIVKLPLRRSWIFITIIGPIFVCHSLTMALWIDLTCPSLASSSWSVPSVVLTALLPTCVNCSTSSIMAAANVSLCFHFYKFAFVLFILNLTDDVTACSKHYVYVCMYVCMCPGPEYIAAPQVRDIAAFSLNLTWLELTQPNGIIVNYFVYINDNLSPRYVNTSITRITSL